MKQAYEEIIIYTNGGSFNIISSIKEVEELHRMWQSYLSGKGDNRILHFTNNSLDSTLVELDGLQGGLPHWYIPLSSINYIKVNTKV